MKRNELPPAQEQNPRRRRRRNPRRKKNGAGLGAFVGSLAGVATEGVLVAIGLPTGITVPLGVALSVAGGALGGHYAAPADRKERGATGGGIGGVFGPLGAALGGYIGGRKPDRRSNPTMGPIVAGTAVALSAVAVIAGTSYIVKRRRIRAGLPSRQPGATPENQGASSPIPAAEIPKAVLDAELAKGGVPVEPWWKTVQVSVYRDHFIRVDEDTRMVQPYMKDDKVCVQSNVRWVVIAGEATWLATGMLERANACASLPPGSFGGGDVVSAQRKIYDQATLAAMDWINLAYPKSKVA
jgi:hypothetical protein